MMTLIVVVPTVQSVPVPVLFLLVVNLLFLTAQSAPVPVLFLLNLVRVSLVARRLVVLFLLVLVVNPAVLILVLVSQVKVVRVLSVVNLVLVVNLVAVAPVLVANPAPADRVAAVPVVLLVPVVNLVVVLAPVVVRKAQVVKVRSVHKVVPVQAKARFRLVLAVKVKVDLRNQVLVVFLVNPVVLVRLAPVQVAANPVPVSRHSHRLLANPVPVVRVLAPVPVVFPASRANPAVKVKANPPSRHRICDSCLMGISV